MMRGGEMQTALSSADREAEPRSRDKRAEGHHTHENGWHPDWTTSFRTLGSRASMMDCAGLEVVEGSL